MSDFTTREPLLTPEQRAEIADAVEDVAWVITTSARLDAQSKSIELLCACVENLSGVCKRQDQAIVDLTARLSLAEKRIHDLIEVHGS